MTIAPAPCVICRRASTGIGFHDRSARPEVWASFCSMECSEVYMVARRKKIGLTQDEANAAQIGGKLAGQYLEQIGKSDMMTMTRPEWARFCHILIEGYTAELQRQADSKVPF